MKSQRSQRSQPSQSSLRGIFDFTLILWKVIWLEHKQPEHCQHRQIGSIKGDPWEQSSLVQPPPITLFPLLIRGAEHKHQLKKGESFGKQSLLPCLNIPEWKNESTQRSAQFTPDSLELSPPSHLWLHHICLFWRRNVCFDCSKVTDINHTWLNNNVQLHRKQVCCSSSATRAWCTFLVGWMLKHVWQWQNC